MKDKSFTDSHSFALRLLSNHKELSRSLHKYVRVAKGMGKRPFLLNAILKAAPEMYMMMRIVLKKGGEEGGREQGEASCSTTLYRVGQIRQWICCVITHSCCGSSSRNLTFTFLTCLYSIDT